jgi:hypothetical protein
MRPSGAGKLLIVGNLERNCETGRESNATLIEQATGVLAFRLSRSAF